MIENCSFEFNRLTCSCYAQIFKISSFMDRNFAFRSWFIFSIFHRPTAQEGGDAARERGRRLWISGKCDLSMNFKQLSLVFIISLQSIEKYAKVSRCTKLERILWVAFPVSSNHCKARFDVIKDANAKEYSELFLIFSQTLQGLSVHNTP